MTAAVQVPLLENLPPRKTAQPRIISFFSGSGFLDLGFEKTGFKIEYVSEFFRPFLDAYQFSRIQMDIEPPEFGYGCEDICDIDKSGTLKTLETIATKYKIQNIPLGFIGGPPCPDFSIGGKNRGEAGENGKLTGRYFDLVSQVKPDFFLFENVLGLWSTKKHKEYYNQQILKARDSGFVILERVVNSIEFGSPQDRNRIIVIGFKIELLSKIGIFGDYNTMEKQLRAKFDWEANMKFIGRRAFTDFEWPQTNDFLEESAIAIPSNIEESLTVEHWFIKNNVTNHANAQHCFKPRQAAEKFKMIKEGDDSRKSFKRLHRYRYSPTAAYGNNEVHLHPYFPRRLTAAEALAIQSMPIDFVLPESMTLSNMFKTIGNGVPFLMAKGIAEAVFKIINF